MRKASNFMPALAGAVAIVLAFWWLFAVTPAYPSTWDDKWDSNESWEWVIVAKPGPQPFQVFQVSEHYCWEWGNWKFYPVERIDRAERLLNAIEAWHGPGRDSPAPVPEPVSLILMGTGLVGLVIVRRKFRRKQV